MEPSILDLNTHMVYIIEHKGGSTTFRTSISISFYLYLYGSYILITRALMWIHFLYPPRALGVELRVSG